MNNVVPIRRSLPKPIVTPMAGTDLVHMRRQHWSANVKAETLGRWRNFYAHLAQSSDVLCEVYQPWVDAIDKAIEEISS
ncbi:hypothetical protein [Celeribacter sp.]|uniref:hypothetical protein n=1 Tax=Celeribacter sp. TaxID=1890673 RepID=UPI003A8FB9B5